VGSGGSWGKGLNQKFFCEIFAIFATVAKLIDIQ
jgi:hypothetical protein